MFISPGKYILSVNREILDFPTCIDFNCTSLTDVCILVKICQEVTEAGQTIVQLPVSVC